MSNVLKILFLKTPIFLPFRLIFYVFIGARLLWSFTIVQDKKKNYFIALAM